MRQAMGVTPLPRANHARYASAMTRRARMALLAACGLFVVATLSPAAIIYESYAGFRFGTPGDTYVLAQGGGTSTENVTPETSA